MKIKESYLRKIIREELKKKINEATMQNIAHDKKVVYTLSAAALFVGLQFLIRKGCDYVLSVNTPQASANQAIKDYESENCEVSFRSNLVYFKFKDGREYIVSLNKLKNLSDSKKKEFLMAIGGPLLERGEESYEEFSKYVNTAGKTNYLSLTNPYKAKGFEESGVRANKAARRNLNFIIKIADEIGLKDIGSHEFYRIQSASKGQPSSGRGGQEHNLRGPHLPPNHPDNNTFFDYFKN